MTHTGRAFKTFGIALAGGTLGYIAGVLSAPASGRDTRRRLGRRLDDEKAELQRKAEHSLRDAKRTIADAMRG